MKPNPRQISFLAKFSLVAFIITAAIAVLLAMGIQRWLENSVLSQAAESAADQVTTILNPNLKPADLAHPLKPVRYDEIDNLIHQNIPRRHIVRIKIWSRSGLLIYSDEKALVGRHFPVSKELKKALTGELVTEISPLEREENVGERERFRRLMEIYVPLRPSNSMEIMGAYEIYQDPSRLAPRIAAIRRYVWSSIVLGFLVLYGSLFVLVRNASRELIRREQENARLYEKAERRLKHLHALHNIDQAISTSLDLRLTLNVVLLQVTTHLEVDAACVLLLKPSTQTLEYAASRGFRSKAIALSHLDMGEGYAGRAALTRRLVSVPNLASVGEEFTRLPLLAGEDFISYYAAPMITKGQVLGVLEVFHRRFLDPPHEWVDFLENLATQTAIAIDNASLFEQLQRTNIELTQSYDATIEGWSRALDLRDKETEGHTQRVTTMTVKLGRAMGMNEADLAHLRRGALLHDIGKMGIPDYILLKPGPLNQEEMEIMHRHPTYAFEMLWPIVFLRPALDIPYSHHERWDGSGYPRGLKEEQIPLAARIFAVVDVWDALCSDRPYRSAWPPDKVQEYLRQQAGQRFEREVVELFLKEKIFIPSPLL